MLIRPLSEKFCYEMARDKLSKLRIMIDFEALSLAHNAAPLSLSAVVFDLDASGIEKCLLNRFHQYVEIGSAFQYARIGSMSGDIDPETVMWWLGATREAQQAIVQGQDYAVSLREVLLFFAHWVKELSAIYHVPYDRIEIWSCGPMADQNWLENAWRYCFDAFDQPKPHPWPWWGVRCGRTMLNMFYNLHDVAFEGTPHVGIDDCCHQARQLFQVIRAIDKASPELRNVLFKEDGRVHDCDSMSPLNIRFIGTEDEDAEQSDNG